MQAGSYPIRIALFLLPIAGCVLGGCAPAPDPEPAVARAEDLREADSELLDRALAEGSPAIRARAALAMGRIQDTGYAAALARASRGGSAEVRRAALFALGQLGLAEGARPPRVAVDACVDATVDHDPAIIADAVEALGKLAPAEIASKLVPFLEHEDERVRVQAAHALFRLRFVPVWRKQVDQPPPLPDRAVAALVDASSDESALVRGAVAHAFSRYGQADAVDALAGLTRDPDEWVRMFAVRALGRSGHAESVESALNALRDESPRVRTEAVIAIATLGAAERLTAEPASDASFHVRAALARALGVANSERTLKILLELEGDTSPTVAGAAIESLAGRLADSYADELRRHLQDDRWPIRAAAARAAGGLGEAGAALLAGAREDSHNSVRLAAFESLVQGAGSMELLAEGLRSDDLAMRGTAVTLAGAGEDPRRFELLTDAFDASAGEEWIEVRESIVDGLARDTDSAETAQTLRRIAAEDPASSVRRRAARILQARGESVSEGAPDQREPSPFLGRSHAGDPVVVIETDRGAIRLRCLARSAPIHVASFVDRVREGFYDGLTWHRVVSDFVIQGGDPRGDGWGGAGYLLRDEINRIPYERGTVGMPKAGKDTGGGQLFITHVPTPHLDGNYTVFAQVTSGMDVVDRIEVGDRIVRATIADH